MTTWWVVVAAALAAALGVPPRARWPDLRSTVPDGGPDGVPDGGPGGVPDSGGDRVGWLRRWRWCWSLLAGLAGATFVSGSWGVPAGVVVAVAAWLWIERSEPASLRRRREAAERELPALVHLLTGALESGCDVSEALRLVCGAMPGAASDTVGGVPARLSLGVPPEVAWRPVVGDPALAPLGRTMVRAHRSGASIHHEVARLADDLERRERLRAEERARAVGVKAAVPLGVCLLPSFLLIGIVPLVVGLLRSLSL